MARWHKSPDAPLVRIKWFPTDLPFLPGETVINCRDLDDHKYLPRPVGEVADWQAPRTYTAQWSQPPGLTGKHVCHAEWFAAGEPWPTALPNTVFDDEWIPECCERLMSCTTEECRQDQVGGQAASQHYQYPIAQVDIVPETPRLFQEVAKNEGDDSPALPGFRREFQPLGTTASWSFRHVHFTNPDGTLVSETITTAINATDYAQQFVTPTQFGFALSIGGVTGTVGFQIVGGMLQMGGTNFQLDPAILPPLAPNQYSFGGGFAAGSTQADATLIDALFFQTAGTAITEGIRLPPSAPGIRVLTHSNGSAAASVKLWPAFGEAMAGVGVDTAYVFAKNKTIVLFGGMGPTGNWAWFEF